MEYKKLGKTDLNVSVISLGTFIYGSQVNEPEAASITERAVDGGVNFFDTAGSYAGGRSEEILGRVAKRHRNSLVLATKVGGVTGPGTQDKGLSRKHIIRAVEDSLRRLATDYIDLYYAHSVDPSTPIDETLRTLDDLVRQGKVRYIGCSNFNAWQLCKALWVSDVQRLARFECVQPPYNLVARDIERELMPLCAGESVGICVYNPLAGGLLTGKYDPDKPPPEGARFGFKTPTSWGQPIGTVYKKRYWSPANLEAVARLKQLANDAGKNLAQLALAWILQNSAIASAICGATSIQQLEQNLGAVNIKLSAQELATCDQVWQGLRPPELVVKW